jgi:hypothetical protein
MLKISQNFELIQLNDPNCGRQFDSILSMWFHPVDTLYYINQGGGVESTDGIFPFHYKSARCFIFFLFQSMGVS